MANYFTKGKLMKGMEIKKKPLLLIWINKSGISFAQVKLTLVDSSLIGAMKSGPSFTFGSPVS